MQNTNEKYAKKKLQKKGKKFKFVKNKKKLQNINLQCKIMKI